MLKQGDLLVITDSGSGTHPDDVGKFVIYHKTLPIKDIALTRGAEITKYDTYYEPLSRDYAIFRFAKKKTKFAKAHNTMFRLATKKEIIEFYVNQLRKEIDEI